MIPYSIAIVSKVPGTLKTDTNRKTVAVAKSQVVKTLTLEDFAQHIAEHGTIFGKDVIEGVLTKVVSCVRELLVEGNRVSLGDLGTFYYNFKTKGAPSQAQCDSSRIVQVKAKWAPGSKFRNLLADATFQLVPSRKAQAAALEAMRDGEEEEEEGGE